jgi:hypothetical protein
VRAGVQSARATKTATTRLAKIIIGDRKSLAKRYFAFSMWELFIVRLKHSMLILGTIAYLKLTQLSLSALVCERIDGRLVLVAERTTICYEGLHLYVAVLSGILLVFFVAGMPIVAARMLVHYFGAYKTMTQSRADGQRSIEVLGFLVRGLVSANYLYNISIYIITFTFASVSVLSDELDLRFFITGVLFVVQSAIILVMRPFVSLRRNATSFLLGFVNVTLAAVLLHSFDTAQDTTKKLTPHTHIFFVTLVTIIGFTAVALLSVFLYVRFFRGVSIETAWKRSARAQAPSIDAQADRIIDESNEQRLIAAVAAAAATTGGNFISDDDMFTNDSQSTDEDADESDDCGLFERVPVHPPLSAASQLVDAAPPPTDDLDALLAAKKSAAQKQRLVDAQIARRERQVRTAERDKIIWTRAVEASALERHAKQFPVPSRTGTALPTAKMASKWSTAASRPPRSRNTLAFWQQEADRHERAAENARNDTNAPPVDGGDGGGGDGDGHVQTYLAPALQMLLDDATANHDIDTTGGAGNSARRGRGIQGHRFDGAIDEYGAVGDDKKAEGMFDESLLALIDSLGV